MKPVRSSMGLLGLALLVFTAQGCSGNSKFFTNDPGSIRIIGARGTGPGQFNEPFAIGVDPKGKIYVADVRNHRIQLFDPNGNFLLQWGSQGNEEGNFERPSGIVIDASGHVFISDYELDRIQKFSSQGTFLAQWGLSGKRPGEFNSPGGLALDSEGFLYVADIYNHRIQKFDTDGNFLKAWGNYQPISLVRSFFNFLFNPGAAGNFNYPSRLTVGPEDTVYVSDSYNNRVQAFLPTENFGCSSVAPGYGAAVSGWPPALPQIRGDIFMWPIFTTIAFRYLINRAGSLPNSENLGRSQDNLMDPPTLLFLPSAR